MEKNGKILPLVLIAITTIIVGSMNTFFIASEDMGSWKNYVGYAFLVIALISIAILIYVIIKPRKK